MRYREGFAIEAPSVRTRSCASHRKLALQPGGDSLDRAMAIQLQPVRDVATGDDDDRVPIFLDFSIRLDVYVACCNENTEPAMSET